MLQPIPKAIHAGSKDLLCSGQQLQEMRLPAGVLCPSVCPVCPACSTHLTRPATHASSPGDLDPAALLRPLQLVWAVLAAAPQRHQVHLRERAVWVLGPFLLLLLAWRGAILGGRRAILCNTPGGRSLQRINYFQGNITCGENRLVGDGERWGQKRGPCGGQAPWQRFQLPPLAAAPNLEPTASAELHCSPWAAPWPAAPPWWPRSALPC